MNGGDFVAVDDEVVEGQRQIEEGVEHDAKCLHRFATGVPARQWTLDNGVVGVVSGERGRVEVVVGLLAPLEEGDRLFPRHPALCALSAGKSGLLLASHDISFEDVNHASFVTENSKPDTPCEQPLASRCPALRCSAS